MNRRAFFKSLIGAAAAVGVLPQLEKLAQYLPVSAKADFNASFAPLACIYYDKRALENLKQNLVFTVLSGKHAGLPKPTGKSIRFPY